MKRLAFTQLLLLASWQAYAQSNACIGVNPGNCLLLSASPPVTVIVGSQGTPNIPIVNSATCPITLPLSVGATVCTFPALNALTSWAIVSQSCANCFTPDNSGNVKGSAAAASIPSGNSTVTVTATNANGTSPTQLQTVAASGGGGGAGAFQGNPNISVASITPHITCLQNPVTLQTPGFLQCSASTTTATCTGTTIDCSSGTLLHPYSNLEFKWNAGDASGTETFTVPTIGTKNANTDQTGGEFVYVYRNAGSYTITLTVRGCTNGRPSTRYTGGGGACNGGAYTTATTTQSVTVTAWTGTGYYFTTSGSDGNACTSGSPCLTPSKCARLIEGGSNRRCNFNCGQTFNGDTGSSLRLSANANYAHARVRSADTTGAACPLSNPAIINTSGGNSCFQVTQNGNGGVKSDIVISNIK